MLLNLILSGDLRSLFIGALLCIPSVVICLSFHEACHGLAAYLMGDRTAKAAGRLTLDPLAHIDPWGFLCMMLLGFGWARPVPVDISQFRNRRLGMGITAFAGPLANIILAFIAYFIMLMLMIGGGSGMNNFLQIVTELFYYIASLSVGLAVFNLLPIHPLDGSRILDAILPFKAQIRYQNFLHRYGSVILLVVVMFIWWGGISLLIQPVRNFIFHAAQSAAFAIAGIPT